MTHTQYFTVLRQVDGEEVEFELHVECQIEPFVPGKYTGPYENSYPDEGGFASIDGPIYETDDDGKARVWGGSLTEDERERVERQAYESWSDNAADDYEPNIDDYGPDDDVLDEDFFHDDRAIALSGGGKVYY